MGPAGLLLQTRFLKLPGQLSLGNFMTYQNKSLLIAHRNKVIMDAMVDGTCGLGNISLTMMEFLKKKTTLMLLSISNAKQTEL